MKIYDWIIIAVVILLIVGIVHKNNVRNQLYFQSRVDEALNMVEEMRRK